MRAARWAQFCPGTEPEDFEECWRVAALGGFVCARETARDMIASGDGVMLFTGATSSVRGGGWLGFSSAKFAVRGLVQSLARELWPRGVHVAHVVIDGIIGSPRGITDSAGGEPLLDPHSHCRCLLASRCARSLGMDARARCAPIRRAILCLGTSTARPHFEAWLSSTPRNTVPQERTA